MRNIQLKNKSDIRQILRRVLSRPDIAFLKFAIILVFLNIIYPKLGDVNFPVQVGDIAQQDVVAPFTFPTKKASLELGLERKKAVESVLPVADYDEDKTSRMKHNIEMFLEVIYGVEEGKLEARKEKLNILGFQFSKGTISLLLKKGIRDKKDKLESILLTPVINGIIYDKSKIPYMKVKRISVRKADGEVIYSPKDFFSISEARNEVKNRAFSTVKKSEDIIKAMDELTAQFYMTNLQINIEETEKRRKEASASVSETKGLVLKGEMIVRAHDQITEDTVLKLNSLNGILGRKRSLMERILLRIGLNTIVIILFFFMYFFVYRYKRKLWEESEKLLIIEIVIIVFLYLVSFLFRLEHIFLFLIPISFIAIVVAMLYGEVLSIIVSIILASLIAVFSGMRFPVFIFLLFSSFAGILGVKSIKRRSQLYKTLIFVSAVNILLAFGLESFSRNTIQNILFGSSFGFISAVASIFLLIGLLPVFERLSESTTNITLFEWSDLNSAILKKLSITAPGTYNHSIVVGNLAEAAAEAIDANSILTRVAAYYHDIGKMVKPEYFIENQMGRKNPHAKLKPRLSCIILISHVKEGVEIARKAGLPKEIIRVIREHHGTSLIIPFFEKAKKQKQEEKVDENAFRYPGPLPSTKESGIVMLADSVEAASRSVEDPNARKIKSLISDIVEERFRTGQLNESQLTLVELTKIGASFLPILVGMHHLRTEYPKKESQAKNLKTTGNR